MIFKWQNWIEKTKHFPICSSGISQQFCVIFRMTLIFFLMKANFLNEDVYIMRGLHHIVTHDTMYHIKSLSKIRFSLPFGDKGGDGRLFLKFPNGFQPMGPVTCLFYLISLCVIMYVCIGILIHTNNFW